MMNVKLLKDEFHNSIVDALKKFSESAENRDVYAMVLDCDSSVGMVSLRYRNKSAFKSELSTYEEYEKKYGWKTYGLHGSEYDPGEFAFIEYQKSDFVRHFEDSYYYYAVGEYYGKGEPLDDIEDDYEEIFWDMIIDTINRIKGEIKEIGIHTTDNFIFFHCDHDQSYEERDKMMSMTVDSELMRSLG